MFPKVNYSEKSSKRKVSCDVASAINFITHEWHFQIIFHAKTYQINSDELTFADNDILISSYLNK